VPSLTDQLRKERNIHQVSHRLSLQFVLEIEIYAYPESGEK
jgi:hypothetical protein